MKSKMIILKIIVFFIFKFFRAEGDNIDVLKPMKRSVDSLSISKMQAPIITTNYGKIAGKTVPVDGDGLAPVVQYLGIPYAKPPVKALRWRKPEDTRFWNGKLQLRAWQKKLRRRGFSCLSDLMMWYDDFTMTLLWYFSNGASVKFENRNLPAYGTSSDVQKHPEYEFQNGERG